MMKKVLLLLTALALMAAGMTSASASHPTWLCVDSGPDSQDATSNDDIVDILTITVGASDDGHPPQSDGCVTSEEGNSEGALIHVEVTGAADEDGDTPATPDLSCTVPASSNRCSVQPPTAAGGTQTLRAWMDSGEGTQIDRAEDADEDNYPGEMGEPDWTDVSDWTWTRGDPQACDQSACGAPTTVTIRHGDSGAFHGRVGSAYQQCETGRVVKLWKKRPGRDRFKGKTMTDGAKWELPGFQDANGPHYVTAQAMHVSIPGSDSGVDCIRGQSENLRV